MRGTELTSIRWRKSSRSNGSGDCLEVGECLSSVLSEAWRKSSYSNGDGDCVEVADGLPGVLPVRDSKVPAGEIVTFAPAAWNAFLRHVRRW